MIIGAPTPSSSAAWVPSLVSLGSLAWAAPLATLSDSTASNVLGSPLVSRSYESAPSIRVLYTIDAEISSGLREQVRMSQAWMLLYGFMTAFFLGTTWRSISYIFRSKVKNKTLFYLLLTSQVIGLAKFTSNIAAGFDQSVNCTFFGRARALFVHLSCACLITGVLGIKAYRCLGDARFVIVVLFVLRGAMMGLLGVALAYYQGVRNASGICTHKPKEGMLTKVVLLQFLETCFLCGCFLFAVWRASRTPADQARMSIRVSIGDIERSGAHTKKENGECPRSRRGWWDYIPESRRNSSAHVEHSTSRLRFWAVRDAMRRVFRLEQVPPRVAFQRKSSIPDDYPLPQPPRASRFFGARASTRFPEDIGRIYLGAPTSSMSALNQFITHVPRMILFRQMLRNELLYTTFLTVIFLVLAILMLVGVSGDVLIGADGWILLDWVIISAFTVHSFGRVVRRHEEEALLRHPSAWDASHRAELEASKLIREKRARRTTSPIDVISEWRPRRRDESFPTDCDRTSFSGRSLSFPPQLAPIPVHAPLSSTSTCAALPSPISLWDTSSTIIIPSEAGCSPGIGGVLSDSNSTPSPITPRDPPWRTGSFSEIQKSITRTDHDRSSSGINFGTVDYCP